MTRTHDSEGNVIPHRPGTKVYAEQSEALLHEARQRAHWQAPYYWPALQRLQFNINPNVPTMGTTKGWVTHVNPERLREWTADETAAVIVHELEHLLRRHHERCGERNPGQFNIAGDLEINQRLSGLPDGGVYPATYDLPDGLTAEAYYALMPQDDQSDQSQDGDGSGEGAGNGSESGANDQSAACGSAAGGEPAEWEADQPGHMSDSERERVIRETAQTAVGNAPSDEVRQWAETELGIDRAEWMRALAAAIGRETGRLSSYAGWAWPGRRDMRDMGGAMLPRYVGHRAECAVIIDTSGSISDGDLDLAMAAGDFVKRNADATFYGCNTRVTEYGHHLPPTITGGGGTDMGIGILHAQERGAELIIVVTDCQTPWPDASAITAQVIVAGNLGASRYFSEMVPEWADYLPLIPGAE